MITKKLWCDFLSLKVVATFSWWNNNYEITPEGKALLTILLGIITPMVIVLDIIGMPMEILYVLLKRKYERELERI